MSAGGHESEAASHHAEAADHRARGEASRAIDSSPCPPVTRQPGIWTPCWSSRARVGAAHLASAEEHRRIAAEHRAASRALRDTEARACVGIGHADRDTSPFAHVEDIASIAPFVEMLGEKNAVRQRTVGAIVTFRQVPGLTAEWLQRAVDCHLARNAVLGNEHAGMDDCPLVPRGVRASVRSTGDGFEVAIRGEDDNAVESIRQRTARLAARSRAVAKPVTP